MQERLSLSGRQLLQAVAALSTQPIPRVAPGDLITADLVNSILDKLDSFDQRITVLESRPGDAGFALGPLATGIHTLIALSSGFEGTSGIWLDGNQLLVGTRGINLIILDFQDLHIKYSSNYDTWANGNESSRLASDLRLRTNRYDVVVVVTVDAYINTGNLSDDVKNALGAVGGAALSEPAGPNVPVSRANAAFIGVVPNNMSNVGFNYLVSVMPADSPGFGNGLLAALPFAWGLYSTINQRFLLGGAANNSDTTGAVPAAQVGAPGIMFQPSLINSLREVRSADPVNRVPGIGSVEMQLLHNNGITNIGELAKADPNHVAAVLNVQPEEANRIVGGLRELLGPGQ